MALDQQKLETALQVGRKSPYLQFSLHLFETVSSTNQILWDLLAQGAESGCVVIATEQTAGRGQVRFVVS
jgi:BirA family transcriptional regulator, biotin operon repressor / biotin---[acetyl-CoA-carboxylase] ligase